MRSFPYRRGLCRCIQCRTPPQTAQVYMGGKMDGLGSSSTRTGRALVALRQKILSGRVPGGTRLFEVALADELQISRTPVRAALSKLAEEGLLDRVKGGGFVVRSFNLSDLVDTIELRGVLEGTAARFAAERGATPEKMAELRRLLDRLDTVVGRERIDLEQFSTLNTDFHAEIAALAQSPVLAREIERMTTLPFASPSAFLEDETYAEHSHRRFVSAQEQHRAILDAIANRESARAEALMREHARTARRNVEFLISQEAALREGVPSLAFLAD